MFKRDAPGTPSVAVSGEVPEDAVTVMGVQWVPNTNDRIGYARTHRANLILRCLALLGPQAYSRLSEESETVLLSRPVMILDHARCRFMCRGSSVILDSGSERAEFQWPNLVLVSFFFDEAIRPASNHLAGSTMHLSPGRHPARDGAR